MMLFLRWVAVLVLATLAGKLIAKLRLPAILGWLIAGMLLGPHAAGLMPQTVLETEWYRTVIMWMQCAFGLMLGTELVWNRMKASGRALIVTTLFQSLGTIAAAAVINEIIAVIAAKKGFELAGEIQKRAARPQSKKGPPRHRRGGPFGAADGRLTVRRNIFGRWRAARAPRRYARRRSAPPPQGRRRCARS